MRVSRSLPILRIYELISTSNLTFLGGHVGGDPPVPVPNTEVKPTGADDSAWGTGCESR